MKTCGIIAEYNPFHNGHAYQIREIRRQLGADTRIICVMSGNFVQRGDAAICEKYLRARMAVQEGADLVLELPLAAALSSAQDFAAGGVGTLYQTGVVTNLCFGTETDDFAAIERAASLTRDPAALRLDLGNGLSYAAAMQRAVSALDPAAGSVLSSPNNTLGVCYCAANHALDRPFELLAISRQGAAHDSRDAVDGFASASLLRQRLALGKSVSSLMPEKADACLSQAVASGEAPVLLAAVSSAMLSHLRRLSPDELARYAGGSDGLSARLYRSIRTEPDFAAVCASAQTRRYPLARIRRALLRAWLDLPVGLPPENDYIRVLAIGKNGRALLREMKTACTIPVITKPLSEQALPMQDSLARDALADDLYALAYPNPSLRVAGDHFRKTPFVAE